MEKEFYKTEYNSPIGRLFLVSDGKNLTGLYIEGQKYFNCPPYAIKKDNLEIFSRAKLWLEEYFKGKNPAVSLPLAPFGSQKANRVRILLLSKNPQKSPMTPILFLAKRENSKLLIMMR